MFSSAVPAQVTTFGAYLAQFAAIDVWETPWLPTYIEAVGGAPGEYLPCLWFQKSMLKAKQPAAENSTTGLGTGGKHAWHVVSCPLIWSAHLGLGCGHVYMYVFKYIFTHMLHNIHVYTYTHMCIYVFT